MRRLAQVLAVSALLALPASAQSDLANAVMVVVNDAVITYKDVMQYVGSAAELLVREYGRQPAVLDQKLKELQRDGIEQLVERKLILAEFDKTGYKLPESLIDDRVKARIRDQFGDRLSLTKSLQARGMTYEAYRQQVREDFIVTQMRLKNIASEIIISPYKIEKYYADNLDKFRIEDQVKVRILTVNQPVGAPAGSAKRLAEEILGRLEQGVPFAEMAAVYSDDSYRAAGGDRGWRQRKDLRQDLADIAFRLKPGQHSGVIESPEGCYLLQVEEVMANHTRTLTEARDEIEKALVAQERARLSKQWTERLKDKAFVRYF